MTGQLNWGSAFEAAGVAAITAGLTNGITYNGDTGLGFTTQPLTLGSGTSSIASLAGVNPAIGTSANQAGMSTASSLAERGLAMLAEAGITAGVSTAIEGGSFASSFENALTGELAAAGAYGIGDVTDPLSIQNILAHAALGCAASAVEGTGCAGGAIGAATSAIVSPWSTYSASQTDASLDGQSALVAAIAMLAGGFAAGLAGANAQAGAAWAQNEALNNTLQHRDQVLAAINKTLNANPSLAAKYSAETLLKAAENVYGGNGAMGVWTNEADAQAATAKDGTTYYRNAQGVYVERWAVPTGAEDVAQNIVDNAYFQYGAAFAAVTRDNQSQLMASYLKTFGADPAQFQGAAELAAGGALMGVSGSITAGSGRTTVYTSTAADGSIQYVGITDSVAARAAAHLAEKGINIQPIPGLQGMSRDDARAVEQVLIEFNGLGKNGGSLLNKINSIATSNPIYASALSRGANILKSIGYPGFK
jgi:filamentous hemagglutinin